MRFAAFALVTLLASPGLASSWDLGCDSDTTNDGSFTIQAATGTTSPVGSRVGCWNFVDADSTTTSPAITVQAETAVACFDPDTEGTATDTSRVKIRWCVAGSKPSSNPSNGCIDMGGALTGTSTLDGTEGHAEVQNACLRIPPGVFYVEVTAACTSDACSVRFVGEAKQ
jgi:hypothetical protein